MWCFLPRIWHIMQWVIYFTRVQYRRTVSRKYHHNIKPKYRSTSIPSGGLQSLLQCNIIYWYVVLPSLISWLLRLLIKKNTFYFAFSILFKNILTAVFLYKQYTSLSKTHIQPFIHSFIFITNIYQTIPFHNILSCPVLFYSVLQYHINLSFFIGRRSSSIIIKVIIIKQYLRRPLNQ